MKHTNNVHNAQAYTQKEGIRDWGLETPYPIPYTLYPKRLFLLLMLIIASLSFAQTNWSSLANTEWYTSTVETSFTLTTSAQLAGLAKLVNAGNNFNGKTIVLGNNIELNANSAGSWQSWGTSAPSYSWTPIGNYTEWDMDGDREIATPFSGTFDGNGHFVSGVYISGDGNYIGLFGYINGGTIKNVGVVNSYIKGGSHVGGLLGYSNGTIINSYSTARVAGSSNFVGGLLGFGEGSAVTSSYATGSVSGTDYVGGLVGYNGEYANAIITNSYATGSVSGDRYVGGLVGQNGPYGGGQWGEGAYGTGTINNSYAVGSVSGSSSTTGSLVGRNGNAQNGATVTYSYYNSQINANANNDIGTGKITSDMQSAAFVEELNTIAAILALNAWAAQTNAYPILTDQIIDITDVYLTEGSGTEADPYIIKTKEDLDNLSLLASYGRTFENKFFKLNNDIKLNEGAGYSWEWNKAEKVPENAFIPIGSSSTPFSGTFDGNGKTISGIYTSNKESDYQGLFGNIGYNGAIKNLNIENSFIQGKDYAGILAGSNSGTITNSSANGNLAGSSRTGGLAGNNSGTISNSYANVGIWAEGGNGNYFGGFVGYNSGKISNSYSIRYDSEDPDVSANNYVGGFVGYNTGTIINTYSTGKALLYEGSNGNFVGGLAGYNTGTVSYSYYNNEKNETGNNIGEGKTTKEMQSKEFADKLKLIASILVMNTWKEIEGEYPVLGIEIIDALDIYLTNGKGTEAEPYIISNKTDLESVSMLVSYGLSFENKFLELGGDIELNEEEEWAPIGIGAENPFSGTFNGNGYVISGVYINNNSNSYQGLFGYIGTGGTIKNLGISNSSVTGNNYIGILAGHNSGTIVNSYAIGDASGNGYVGGLAGNNIGAIKNSYAVVNVPTTGSNIGKLVGLNSDNGSINNSYYNSEKNGSDNKIGEGKTDNEMKDDPFINSLNIVASVLVMNVWEKSEGYPVLDNEIAGNLVNTILSGTGTEQDPYIIKTKDNLNSLSDFVRYGETFEGKFLKLANDIEVNSTAGWETWNESTGDLYKLNQIGDAWEAPFRGTFDGNGHVISGIYMYNSGANELGLFGVLGTGGTIKNIGVINSYINGNDNVGILAGVNNSGTITNSYTSGKINGGRSYNYGNDGGTGGLVGFNCWGTIINSYSTATVSGVSYVGGLVGLSEGGSISNSYAAGSVSANSNYGGLVGQNNYNVIISNSYYNSQTTENGNSYGTAKITAEMQNSEFAFILNLEAISLSMNAWIYTAGSYPTLSNELAVLNISSYFASGNGTMDSPYIIKTEDHLKNLSMLVNNGIAFRGEYLQLGNSIALENDEWTAIGSTNNNPFSGTFNGNGYVISNVNINKSSSSYQGLFGYVLGTIKNLGVESSNVTGNEYVGILAGRLSEENSIRGSVINSYAIGSVSGSRYVGGLVGENYRGTISNSYAAATVPATTNNIGKLVGNVNNYNNNGTVSNSYYNSQTTGNSNSYGTAKTTAEMQSGEFALILNFGASSLSMNVWTQTDSEYPALTNQIAGEIEIADYIESGAGTATAPYIITTKEELAYLAVFVNNGYSFEGRYFKLGKDIELNANSATAWQTWASNAPAYVWTPIGAFSQYYNSDIREYVETSNSFRGTFDGDGKTISGVYINNNNNNYQGLFGYIGNDGTIKNLGVINSYVKGNEYVGGLLGLSNGTVINSYANVNVVGISRVGGLVGAADESTISDSYAMGAVSGNNDVGGLVGNSGQYGNSKIINSYSTGAVTGTGGGLVGSNNGTISNSYVDIGTSGRDQQICGYNNDTWQWECNSLGRSTEEMKNAATYVSGGWDFTIWTIDSEVNSGYPFHRTTQLPSIAEAQVEFNNQRLTESGIPTTLIQIGSTSLEATLKSAALGETALIEGTDYQVFYADNSEVGTAKLAILGIGKYSGAAAFDYYITEDTRDMDNATVEPILEQLLTDPDPIPVVKDYFGSNCNKDYWGNYSSNCVSVILTKEIDYTLNIIKPASDGEATIYILAVNPGIYKDYKLVKYSIVGSKNLSSANGSIAFANPSAEYTYNGKPHTPAVVVSYEGVPLVEGEDYELSYSENINAGKVIITATGIDNFIGERYIDFTINAQSIATSNSNIQVNNIKAVVYETGVSEQPELVITDMERDVVLERDVDYTATYLPYSGPTTQAIIIVNGTGNYKDNRTVYFTVTAEEEETIEIKVTWENLEFTYDGTEKKPTATATLEGTPISLQVNTIGGAAINAKSEYYTARASFVTPNSLWELTNAEVQFKINKASISATLSISDVNIGKAPSPSVSSYPGSGAVTYLYSLNESSGYTEDVPTESGVYFVKAVIAATTNYESYTTEVKSFSITNPLATPVAVVWTLSQTFTYDGTEQKPTATASLVGGGTLDIVISGATDAGLHTAVARIANSDDAAEYELTNATFQFYIGSRNISAATIEPISDKAATGSPIKPSVVIKDLGKTLVEGKDYELSYDNNIEAGTGIVTATGIGNYTYFIEQTFTILEGFINIAVEWGSLEFTYNGAEQKPTATATTAEGDVLALTITGGKTNAGTYTATATLATPSDLYALTNETKQFTIAAKTLASNAIQAIASVTETGSQIKPTVVVKDGDKTLVLGTDYEVSYGANTAAGTNAGTVTVTGKGNYKGTAEATFTINEAPEITDKDTDTDPCKDDPSSCLDPVILPQIALGQISVQPVSGGILLENLPSNAKVEIFNLQGKQVYSAMSVKAQCIVPLQTKGMYIVKVGTQTFRATVR